MHFIYTSVLILFLAGCSAYDNTDRSPSIVGDINTSSSWYSDANNDVIDIKIAVPMPNKYECGAYDNIVDIRPCTFEDIEHDESSYDSYKPVLSAVFSADNFQNVEDNIVFKLRGDYSRTLEQKSYSAKLFSKDNLFMSQRKFQFIKSQSDRSRVKNKLAYDLFREIPNITSLKTQFFNLWIKSGDEEYKDYGLFTHVEAVRKEYLVNRGLNPDDNLYNVANFMFNTYDELAVNKEGVPLDEEAFGSILEIKNGEDHRKLNEMLEAVNSTQNINEVIEKYFNRNNYLTWLATNLVLGNKDTTYHNFYLYNPKYSNTFYFLPWDYDGAWASTVYLGKDEYGISIWWESTLHRKFLSDSKNREDLYKLADELREKYITDEKIESKIEGYKDSIRHFMSQLPDSLNNSESSWEKAINNFTVQTQSNIDLYKSVIGHPMPFREFATYENEKLNISWDESIDLEGDAINYDLYISKDGNFSTIVYQQKDINVTSLSLVNNKDINLTNGNYFLRVVSKEVDNPEHYQIAFDQYYYSEIRYGVLMFNIEIE